MPLAAPVTRASRPCWRGENSVAPRYLGATVQFKSLAWPGRPCYGRALARFQIRKIAPMRLPSVALADNMVSISRIIA